MTNDLRWAKKSLDDVEFRGERVLIRADFNVPLDEALHVTDQSRIRATLPTLKKVLEKGGRPVLMSHLGRPKGQVVEAARLNPVAEVLGSIFGQDAVKKVDTVVGKEVQEAAHSLQEGQMLLLENLRFEPGETKNDSAFAEQIASLGSVFVNDAFGTCHRKHASVYAVPKSLKGPAVAGLLVQRELEMFSKILGDPEPPFVAILGGAKVSDKIEVIENLIPRCQALLIGGAMAYTFLKAKGVEVGRSRVEEDKLDLAKRLLETAESSGCELHLPTDHVVAAEFAADSTPSLVSGAIPSDRMGLDIGPQSADAYAKLIAEAKSVVWNGPMGVFEFDAFASGTKRVANAVAESSALSLLGGGDSAAAAHKFGVADRVTHVSTGGGASLELLSGTRLPGIEVLDNLDDGARV